jgi:hypothetical protein
MVGRKMVGGMLTGALSMTLLVTGATVTLAQGSAASGSKPAAKAVVAKGIPLPPSPPGLRNASVTIALPSAELLAPQREPDCEISAADRLLGAVPETTRLIYERQCYKNAETVVRSKLQLLQDTMASTLKALNDAGASRTLQPAEGGEQGEPAPAKDVALAPKADTSAKSADASAKSSVAPGNAVDAAVSERAHPEKARGTQAPKQTPNTLAGSKPATASAKAVECQTSRPAGPGPRSWRLIDGRKCWYEGALGMDRSLLHWPPL